jgi:tetratricopeptide (TPR) repeat protein
MHEIFISYSSKHRDLMRALAAAIEAQYGAGSVWWDRELESRASYSEQIKAALEKARVVVVVWTAGAMILDYVYAEAVQAQASGKLVNVRPADMSFRDIPEPFNIYHIDEAEDHARILATIAKVMEGTPIPTRVPLHEIYYRQYGHRLIDPRQSRLARDPREILPTELLQARSAVVPYADVTGMKADLLAWCRDGAHATASRLVHGPGGLGKTRLLIEVAAALREAGWMAGFLDWPPFDDDTVRQRRQALDQLAAHSDDNGLLIVMDYAEARQDEVKAIAERLSRRPDGDNRPVRVVLLTRTAGEWWTTLYHEMPAIQRLFRSDAHGPAVIALPTIATPEQRRALFFATAQAMAPTLAAQGYIKPAGEPSPNHMARIEQDLGHARPLAVQMEALLWLTSAAPDAGTVGVDELLSRVLGLERAHWSKLLGALDDDGKRDMARGVAQATVVQGTGSKASTERLLMTDRFYGDQRNARIAVDPVTRRLLRLYGKPDDSGVWPLEPDLIGEHHVAMTADPELIDGCLTWIGDETAESQEKRRRDFLTVLQRATHPDHGKAAADASALLGHLVSTRTRDLAADMVAVMIDTPVDTPGALLGRLEQHLAALDEETLMVVSDSLPRQSLALMEFSGRVAVRLVDCAREKNAGAASAVSPGGRKSLLSRLGGLLTRNLGLRSGSSGHDASLSRLATGLNNLGVRLSSLGQREGALATSVEAVAIYRRLAAARPEAFLPDLARSLNNLGSSLSDLGRREEALAASQEAVAIRRRLARTRPDVFQPDLAMSLNNLGKDLSNLGRREEALAASQEAVAIRRRLAQTRPDAFQPDLAMSLNNLGMGLSDLGRREEALAASQEAVAIRRRLAQTRPDAFQPDLAMSLNNLGKDLSNLGRSEEALAVSQEAVAIYRRVAATRPDAFQPDLAMSLTSLGVYLSALGRREEALTPSAEAVAIYRRIAATRPDAFLPDLATSLHNLGGALSDLGRREEALTASVEAVAIYRRLAATRPDAFLPGLATSLNSLGNRLFYLGRREEALTAGAEAVALYRSLAATRPDAFQPDLARSLGAQGRIMAQAGRHDHAAGAYREGLAIIAPFVEGRREAFGNLALSLCQNYAVACVMVGIAPDRALLERVGRALGGGLGTG